MRLVIVLLVLLASTPGSLVSQPAVVRLTLEEALQGAHEKGAALEALRQKVIESERRAGAVRATSYPQLKTELNYRQSTATQSIVIPQGSLGVLPELGGAFPPQDLDLEQGGTGLFYTLTTLTQPLSHLFKIRRGYAIAQADEEIARLELQRAENEVALGAMRLFAGVRIAQVEREAAELRLAAAEATATYRQVAVASGTVLDVATTEARVRFLDAQQKLLEVDARIDDLQYDLAELLGAPAGTRFELVDSPQPSFELAPLDEYTAEAMQKNPDVQEAAAMLRKAQHGVGAARADYIPEVGLVGTHVYQSAVPFLPNNSFGVGVQLQWTIVDFGRRSHVLAERRASYAAAQANLRRVEGRVRGDVEKAYRKLQRASMIRQVAQEAAELRREVARLQATQHTAGFVLAADAKLAAAEQAQSLSELLQAEFGQRLAWAELRQAVGRVVP